MFQKEKSVEEIIDNKNLWNINRNNKILSPVEVSCFAEASRRVYVCLNGWGVGGADVYCEGRDGMDGSLFGSKSVPKNVLV